MRFQSMSEAVHSGEQVEDEDFRASEGGERYAKKRGHRGRRLFGQRWCRRASDRPDSGRFQSGEELSLTRGLSLACLDELEDLVEASLEGRVLGIEVFLRATAPQRA